MKRHGWRRWHRFVCRILGHEPWYSSSRKNWLGLIEAYIMSCWRCGEVLDTFHPEAFDPVPTGAVAGRH